MCVNLFNRYENLMVCKEDILKAIDAIVTCYKNGGKILVCGNGGSSADSAHIVGELLKGFMSKRPLGDEMKEKLISVNGEHGGLMAEKLQGSLPAVDLTAMQSIISAVANDTDPVLAYAQQVIGLGKPGDVLIGLSTSGNAANVLCAGIAAKAQGLITVALTGRNGGKMKSLFDIAITVPADSTPDVQELHLPVYHAICEEVEKEMFGR